LIITKDIIKKRSKGRVLGNVGRASQGQPQMVQVGLEVAAGVQGSGGEQTFMLHREDVMYLERAWNIFFVIMGRTRITINVSREVPIIYNLD
jgi:hypothetical protein